MLNRTSIYLLLAALICGAGFTSVAGANDALDEHAIASPLASKSVLLGLCDTGSSLIAVGERGHVLYSDDKGQEWHQADVPVRVTLTSVYFISPDTGWAAGHDGVILKTEDGGRSWLKILDGNRASILELKAVQAAIDQLNSSDLPEDVKADTQDSLDALLFNAKSFVREGASRPFLDIWFRDAQYGIAVGAYGILFVTDDGGNSWQARPSLLDNPNGFHLNQITQINNQLFIVGEAGSIFVSNDDGASWHSIDSPYEGSLFGIASLDSKLIVFGLRGNAFLYDSTTESWSQIHSDDSNSLFAAATGTRDSLLLVGNGGVIKQVDHEGKFKATHHSASKSAITDLVVIDNRIITSSMHGIEVFEDLL